MKLTVNQIERIDKTLTINGIIYDDLKLEIIDHIASEIEAELKEKDFDFETVFVKVFERWKKEFVPTTYGFWLGYFYSGPKIYMDRFLKFTKNEYKWGVILIVFAVLIKLFNYDIYLTYEYSSLLTVIVKVLVAGLFVIFVLGRLLLLKSRFISTYSEMFKKRTYLTVLYFVMTIVGAYPVLPVDNQQGKLLSLVFIILFISYIFNGIRLLVRHYRTKKQFGRVFN